ncbi:MAG: hypothetical protein HYS06_04705 [Methylocystis sp.]|nr:hypothetical protein [Methylocystis sp.]
MPTHSIKCPVCGDTIDYWRVYCRREHFVGYPNRRAAEGESDELAARHEKARQDASKRRVPSSLLAKLEALAEASQPVIDMRVSVCDNLLRGGKYRNYDQRVESDERPPASAQDHADREMVGSRLFPRYSQHIVYAALSADGRGTKTYGGEVWMRWTPFFFDRWVSLLEENSFTFYEQHSLGRIGAVVPTGYRAVWEDRAKLVITKLAPRLTSATAARDLEELLLHAGETRKDDKLVEVHIYAEGGLDTRDVDLVAFQRPPGTADEEQKWAQIRDMCAQRSIVVR